MSCDSMAMTTASSGPQCRLGAVTSPGASTRRWAAVVWLLAVGLLLPVGAASAATCAREDFANAIDQAGASLRAFNGAAVPKIQDKLKQLQAARGWSDVEAEDKAVDYLHDARVGELDAEANALLERIDQLGQVPENGPLDCSRLDELKASSSSLLDVMRKKSAHTMARLDSAIAKPATTTPAPLAEKSAGSPAASEATKAVVKPPVVKPAPDRVAKSPAEAPRRQDAAAPPPRPPATAPQQPWQSATRTTPSDDAVQGPPATPLPPVEVAAPADAEFDNPDGFTIDEIRLATRGFFGTVSTNLASVVEYAFSRYGRPAGYVLGQEGGGAFLAGLRYGQGTVYMRTGASRPIYWHGPSIGYDFGAEGSRTLFLIYNLAQPDDLFRRFAGVDGSAYLVGGVGLTVLKGGPVVMAPIRTGLGLRLGANIGYLRFTPEATWNPF